MSGSVGRFVWMVSVVVVAIATVAVIDYVRDRPAREVREIAWQLDAREGDAILIVAYEIEGFAEGCTGLRRVHARETAAAVTVLVEAWREVGGCRGAPHPGVARVRLDQPLADRDLRGCNPDDRTESCLEP